MCEMITMAAIAGSLQTVGTAVTIAGSLYSGINAYQTANYNAELIENQMATEQVLASVKDNRLRDQMKGEMAKQRLELVGRGVSLDSPTAIVLGRTAAEEMSFASQSVRSEAGARKQELTAEKRMTLARGKSALLKGGFSAAGTLLDAAPDIWPSLKDERVLQ